MIVFQRHSQCHPCERITEALDELVVAHRVEELRASVGSGDRPPAVLEDGEERVMGHDAILARVEDLKAFKSEWDKFQTDACYCDEEGNVE